MNNKIISVKGDGKLKMSPDLTIIDFELEIENKSYDKAYAIYEDSLKRLNEIINVLGFSNKDLKTRYWNSEPVTRYEEKYNLRNERITEEIIKYKINHSLKLEFDLDNETLSNILSEISKSEFPLDINIGYGVKDKNSVKIELLKKAIIDAKNKAKIMLESIGEELGELIKINYNVDDSSIQLTMPFDSESICMENHSARSYDFVAEDIELCDDVEVIWRIK